MRGKAYSIFDSRGQLCILDEMRGDEMRGDEMRGEAHLKPQLQEQARTQAVEQAGGRVVEQVARLTRSLRPHTLVA